MKKYSIGRLESHDTVSRTVMRRTMMTKCRDFLGRELEGVADSQEALPGYGNRQPPATADHKVKGFKYGQAKVHGEEISVHAVGHRVFW